MLPIVVSIPLSAGHDRDFFPHPSRNVKHSFVNTFGTAEVLALEVGQLGIESFDDPTGLGQQVALEGANVSRMRSVEGAWPSRSSG